jgi:CRISPR-associated protein Cmr3
MNTQYFSITPQDAWFFRDGRPYNHRESNQFGVQSVFPPPARTLTGGLRAALARANGWDGKPGGWPSNITNCLGDGPNNLGKLQFTGPFLIREKEGSGSEALWPIPRHLLGCTHEGHWKPSAFLQPDEKETETDNGRCRLPRVLLPAGQRPDGLKPAGTAWITTPGLTTILAGKNPQAEMIHQQHTLWKFESRVGLQRDAATLNVGEGDLYSPIYVRLCRKVGLGVGLEGLPNNMNGLPSIFPFGGESRLAQAESWHGNPLPNCPPNNAFIPDGNGVVRFIVVLLTHGRFRDPAPLLSSGAKIISACVDKPQLIGGWDSLKNEPLPLEPFHPAGSVWFCEAPAAELPNILAQHGKWLGEYSAHGFGQIAIGLWPSNQTLQK